MSSTLAFGWMWGWSWPCFNSNLLCFLMELWKKYYNSGQNILRHLRKLVAKTHYLVHQLIFYLLNKLGNVVISLYGCASCVSVVETKKQEKKKKKQETIIASENKLFAAPYFPVIAKSSALCKGHPISAYPQN